MKLNKKLYAIFKFGGQINRNVFIKIIGGNRIYEKQKRID
jgi:hypothetical protein